MMAACSGFALLQWSVIDNALLLAIGLANKCLSRGISHQVTLPKRTGSHPLPHRNRRHPPQRRQGPLPPISHHHPTAPRLILRIAQ